MHNIHMLDRPYIQDILEHLQSLGYEPGKAKELLIQFYRSIKRIYGFYLLFLDQD